MRTRLSHMGTACCSVSGAPGRLGGRDRASPRARPGAHDRDRHGRLDRVGRGRGARPCGNRSPVRLGARRTRRAPSTYAARPCSCSATTRRARCGRTRCGSSTRSPSSRPGRSRSPASAARRSSRSRCCRSARGAGASSVEPALLPPPRRSGRSGRPRAAPAPRRPLDGAAPHVRRALGGRLPDHVEARLTSVSGVRASDAGERGRAARRWSRRSGRARSPGSSTSRRSALRSSGRRSRRSGSARARAPR